MDILKQLEKANAKQIFKDALGFAVEQIILAATLTGEDGKPLTGKEKNEVVTKAVISQKIMPFVKSVGIPFPWSLAVPALEKLMLYFLPGLIDVLVDLMRNKFNI